MPKKLSTWAGEDFNIRNTNSLESIKLCSQGALPIHLFRHFCGRMHRLGKMSCKNMQVLYA